MPRGADGTGRGVAVGSGLGVSVAWSLVAVGGMGLTWIMGVSVGSLAAVGADLPAQAESNRLMLMSTNKNRFFIFSS